MPRIREQVNGPWVEGPGLRWGGGVLCEGRDTLASGTEEA
jgi:hypothetical protein